MQRFVVLAVPRTGSNLLCTLLNSHPEILCHHEVFNPQGIFLALSHRDQVQQFGDMKDRDQDPLAFLESVWDSGANHRCVGFKWTRGQDESVLRRVSEDAGVKKLVLQRRNRLKTFVSDKIAQATQQWEVYSHHDLVSPRPRVNIDCTELLEHIAVNDRFYDELLTSLQRSSQPFLMTQYEDLFCREEQVRILKFLGVTDPDFSLQEASVKQNSTHLEHSIANFAELEASFQGSDLLAELYECES